LFLLDESLRAVPAGRDHIVELQQSLNSPYVAIPGKQAGPAQAFIVSLRGQSGFSVYVYLYLSEVPDCAIYASGQHPTTNEDYRREENEAIAFVESMGFLMDTMNFRALKPDAQKELLRTLPIFKRDLRPVPAAPHGEPSSVEPASPLANLIGKVFSSF
jgi:hypothetical protein